MKFQLSRDVFNEAVQWTAKAVQQRPAIPILSALRVKASSDGALQISSFDYEVSALANVEANVFEPGETLVSGSMVSNIAKALPHADVTVSLDDSHVDIVCGRTRFALGTMPLEDYPDLPMMPAITGVVGGTEFADAVSQVAIATSRDDTLPLLTGVQVNIEGENITLLATDRYRLAQRKLTWRPTEEDFTDSLLVKAKVLTDVARNLGGGGDIEVHISGDAEQQRAAIIGFSAGERQSTSSLMDGDYPPVQKLFPEDTPLEYVCDRHLLLEAVRRVSLVVERKTQVRLVFEDGAVKLEAGQGDSAQAEEMVALVRGSEPLQTAFNPAFLQDGLAAMDTDYVRFGFTDATKAAVLMGQKEEDGPVDDLFKYLLMPIRFGA